MSFETETTLSEAVAVAVAPAVPEQRFKLATDELLARGIPVIPIPAGKKGCILKDWPSLATTDPSQVAKWGQQNPHQNAGAVAKPSGFCILDIDDLSLLVEIPLPATFTVKSSKGLHFYFKQTDATRALGNRKLQHKFDFQQSDKYVVGPHSFHPDGTIYTPQDISPIIPCPDYVAAWIDSLTKASVPMQIQSQPSLLVGGQTVTKEHFESWLELHGESVTSPERIESEQRWKWIRTERCPWESEHTNANADKDFALYLHDTKGPQIHCVHGHEKHWKDYRAFLTAKSGKNFSMLSREAITDTDTETLVEVVNPEMHEASSVVTDMPTAVLDGKLGEICQIRMAKYPLAYAWPTLVTVAGVRISQPVLDGSKNQAVQLDDHDKPLIIQPTIRSNVYLCLVGPAGTGKTSAFDHALRILDVNPPVLMTMKAGSGEGLVEHLDAGGDNRLLYPDEISHLLEKANSDHSCFSFILNSAFYHDSDALVTKGKTVKYNARLSVMGGTTPDLYHDSFRCEDGGRTVRPILIWLVS